MQPSRIGGGNLPGLTLLSALFAWGAVQAGPVMAAGGLRAFPAMLLVLAGVFGLRLLIEVLMRLARLMDWLSAHAGTGKGGTAFWARTKHIRKECSPKHEGPFWGLMLGVRKRPLFADYVSNAMTVAPAGSGKGIFTVVPMGLSIRHSKVFADFKGELACVLKAPLEERGENVRILNPADLWPEQLGQSASYNPIDIIADSFYRPGGLRDVPDDLREMSAQLLPEPAGTEEDNAYWREGSRRIMSDGILLEAMVEGYDATLSSVALLLEDRETLERNLRWVVGVDLEGKPLYEGPMPIDRAEWAQFHDPEDLTEFAKLARARAANWLKLMCTPDSRTFDSFISGAQQALAPFAFSRLATAMGRSTFSMNEPKEGEEATTLFIVADSSRMETHKRYTGLMQWCAMTAIKRHPNKARPVSFIMDEAINSKVQDLENLLTWGRSYGLRMHLIFQDLSAFERVYGRSALETLWSETECKQFLPGQRSTRTLEMIETALGEQSVMGASLSAREDRMDEQTSESGRPLMTADEIRRSPHGLLFVRQAPPIRFEPISYSEVDPWRHQAGINPFHGKPFLQKVKLKL